MAATALASSSLQAAVRGSLTPLREAKGVNVRCTTAAAPREGGFTSTSTSTSSSTRPQLFTAKGSRFGSQEKKSVDKHTPAASAARQEGSEGAGCTVEAGAESCTANSGSTSASDSGAKLQSLQCRRNLKARLSLASTARASSTAALRSPRHSALGTPKLSAFQSPRFSPLGSRRRSPVGSPRPSSLGSRRRSMFKSRRHFGEEREGEMEGAETSIEIRAGGVKTSVPVTFPPKLPVTLPMTPSPALPLSPCSFSAFALSLSLSFPFSFNLSPSFNCFVPVAVSLSLSLSPYSSGRGWQGSVETAVELSVGDAQFPFSVPMCMPHIGNTELMASIPFAAGAVALLGTLMGAASFTRKASVA